MDGDPVELGVELLRHAEDEELSVADAIDRIEAITTDPHLTRRILRAAEREGVVEREDAVLRPTAAATVDFESDVVEKEGEFDCRRCGRGLSTGYFVRFDGNDLEMGPFGSSCIRSVTGRD